MTTETELDTPLDVPSLFDPEEVNVFIDIETFGLNVVDDGILEIGIAITDLQLNILHSRSWLVWQIWYPVEVSRLELYAKNGEVGAQAVLDMHRKSGLFQEAKLNGQSVEVVEDKILEWLTDLIGFPILRGEPLIGSSVNFDRMFLRFNMIKLFNTFHYRVGDISSLKIFAKKYRPDIYNSAKALAPTKAHRALSDIRDSIEELRYYLVNMLHIEELKIDG